ncbi:acyl-ACP--UDP-N-acetylglucosamine O-acyltransferase [Chlamydiota bacterium]
MVGSIHNTALIDKTAKIADTVTIGPYSVIKKDVVIGEGSVIDNTVTIGPNTTIGRNCRIHSGAVVGGDPQDLKYTGVRSYAKIGNGTIIRECVTVNRGTDEESATSIGKNCLIMAYTHIAHNCTIGNSVIIANAGTLAGHVTIYDRVVMGGLAGIHQFCRIGTMAIIGGCSKVVQDIIPFASVDGNPAVLRTVNVVGLTRNGIPKNIQQVIRQAYKILLNRKIKLTEAIQKIKNEIPSIPEIETIVTFIENSQRGIPR